MRTIAITLICGLVLTVSAAWTPPVGIPNPSNTFGWPIDRATPAWPASWGTTPTTATAGYYYVDKTAPGATDSANTYGYPDKPRATPPENSLAEGAFVYIHAGVYTSADSTGDRFNWYGNGTSANPIWITGNPTTRPVLRDFCHIGEGGSVNFLVFENLSVSGANACKIEVRPTVDGTLIDHVLIRNCDISGLANSGDTDGVLVGISASSDTVPNSTISNVVVYSCIISNKGDMATTEQCGVYAGYHVDSVWCVDNVIHNIGADCVAGSHYSNGTTKQTRRYFIGRNTLYAPGENTIDLKGVYDAIISENVMHDAGAREQGWSVVLHYGASPSTACSNVWVLNNSISHTPGAVYTSSVGCNDLKVLGNVVYDVKSSYTAQADVLNGKCIYLAGSDGTFVFANNTFYDYENGISISLPGAADTATVWGNIFSSRNDNAGYEVSVENGVQTQVDIDYNRYYEPADAATFVWANAERNLAYMKGTAGESAHDSEGDPGLASPPVNFALSASSACIGANATNSIYSTFAAIWGTSAAFDKAGRARPIGGSWDIGAYEYQPPAATAVSVRAGVITHP